MTISAKQATLPDGFTELLVSIIADVQKELGFTDEEVECANGSLEIVAAIRELKGAEKDAERYRWLRADPDFAVARMADHMATHAPFPLGWEELEREPLDAAIDSALSAAMKGDSNG